MRGRSEKYLTGWLMLNQEVTGRQPLCICSLHQSQTQANSTVHLNLERKLSRSPLLLVKIRLAAISICLFGALHPVHWKNTVQPSEPDGVVLRGKHLIAEDSRVKVRTVQWERATHASEMPFNVQHICVNHHHFGLFCHIYGAAADSSYGCRSLFVQFSCFRLQHFLHHTQTKYNKLDKWLPGEWPHVINSTGLFGCSRMPSSSRVFREE